MSTREAVICEPVRTPIGRYGQMFKSQTAVDLGVAALTGLLERTGIPPESVQDVILGHCYPSSEAPAIGRVVALDSGLPVTVPGMQVDRRCGSGLQAVIQACLQVSSGDNEDAEDAYVNPILDKLDPEMRDAVIATIHSSEEETDDQKKLTKKQIKEDRKSKLEAMDGVAEPDVVALKEEKPEPESVSILTPLEKAIKEVKAAYVNAKKAYRISAFRRQQSRKLLNAMSELGTFITIQSRRHSRTLPPRELSGHLRLGQIQ